VLGTQAELDAYKTAQGEFYRTVSETDLRPLFFTNRFAGNTAELIITSKGKIMADMSAFDAASNLASQYGGNLGQELAKQAVAQLLGKNNQVPEQQDVKDDADLSKS
jgi:hypothetical protein